MIGPRTFKAQLRLSEGPSEVREGSMSLRPREEARDLEEAEVVEDEKRSKKRLNLV